MKRTCRASAVVCAIAATALMATQSAGSIIPVQRTSTIAISNGPSRSYTELGVYNDAIVDPLSGASQISSISSQLVSFDCTLRGGRFSEIFFTMGTSSIDLVFNIDEATPFTIQTGGSGHTVSMHLQGPGVDLSSPADLNTSGAFVPGQYSLVLDMSATASIGDPIPTVIDGEGSFRLSIPEPIVATLVLPGLIVRRRHQKIGAAGK